MKHDVVGGGGAIVGFRDEFGTDGDLGGEADDRTADIVGDEGGDCAVDVAWVGGVEGAEDEEDFAGAVGGSVEQGCAGHFEGVFEGWVAFWFGLADLLDGGDVVVWVAGHV